MKTTKKSRHKYSSLYSSLFNITCHTRQLLWQRGEWNRRPIRANLTFEGLQLTSTDALIFCLFNNWRLSFQLSDIEFAVLYHTKCFGTKKQYIQKQIEVKKSFVVCQVINEKKKSFVVWQVYTLPAKSSFVLCQTIWN